MTAVAALDDEFARTGLQVLRATGMRIGELLDLELDCIVDFGPRGTWLRVPLGKLATERMVPLDDDVIVVLDAWTPSAASSAPSPVPVTAASPTSCSSSTADDPPHGACAAA